MSTTPLPSDSVVSGGAENATPAAVRCASFWKALWNVLRFVLPGAVFLEYAMIVIGEGRPSPIVWGFSGAFASFFAAWLLGKGAGCARKKANEIAIDDCAAAIRNVSATAVSLRNRGLACHGQGEYAKAIAHFDAALRLDPTISDPYVGRVNAYGAIGQWDRMIAEYTEIIQLEPDNALAWCARATAFNGIGQFDRAIPEATAAIRLAPSEYLGYDARGWGFLQQGSFNWILKLIAIAWMLASFGFLRRDRFDCRTRTGLKTDFEQSIADLTEAIRLRPTAWDCYQGRARAYRAIGDDAKAASDEAKVRELRW